MDGVVELSLLLQYISQVIAGGRVSRLDLENLPKELFGRLDRPAWQCCSAIATASEMVAIRILLEFA